MLETSSDREIAKSETPRTAQSDVPGRRKPDWWLIGSLFLVTISIFGLAYMVYMVWK